MAKFLTDQSEKKLKEGLEKLDNLSTKINKLEIKQSKFNATAYIVLVPAEGIPPLQIVEGGADICGQANCNVYRIIRSGSSKKLIPARFNAIVLNVSGSWIDSKYAIATQTADGYFVVECPCYEITGTGSSPVDTGTGTGTGTATTGTGTGSTGTGSGTGSGGTGGTGGGTGTGTGSAGCIRVLTDVTVTFDAITCEISVSKSYGWAKEC